MKLVLKSIRQMKRRLLGRYEVIDPRPIARAAKYTFFLPEQEAINSVQSGDLVKLIFSGKPPSQNWEAERMWVTVTEISAAMMKGILANVPSDLPQLRLGSPIEFQSWKIVDIRFKNGPPKNLNVSHQREYWDRCLVDREVLSGELPVGYIYKEAPRAKFEEEFSDSGWRIRGDMRGQSEKIIDDRETEFVALGAVLNKDDSWVHLLDEPIGSAFVRNFNTGRYEAVDR